jgi:hypothetical protein
MSTRRIAERRVWTRALVINRLGSLLAVTLLAGPVLARADKPVDFRRDVAPIFERHCIRCHQPANLKGKLSLTTIEDLKAGAHVVPGRPDESGLLELVTAQGPGERPEMPRKGEPLSPGQVDVLRRWIAEGASWPREHVLQEKARADTSWWSLRPLAALTPPVPTAGLRAIPDAWTNNPIDRFVLVKLFEKGLLPSPPADRRTLIRRVTYDLTGLPPTPEEVDAFVADRSPLAYEAIVDRLLASPHYGERWGRHWLDVVRFGESVGFERNIIIDNAWPFRDHVIRSFNEDKPFDELVLDHLAGDVIGPGNPAVEVGTGFLVCGAYDNVKNADPVLTAQNRANEIDEMVRATSEAFLGLTVGCARCHNHKFDPILQHDYYRLHATFAGVTHASRLVATPAARRAYEASVKFLQAEQSRLGAERTSLENRVVTRGEGRAQEYEARWLRPPAEPGETVETFAPVEARFVRLVVTGRKDNPDLSTGYGIDEFEVWTAEGTSRNVALAVNGGQAGGASRAGNDFSDAYSAKLAIDGKFAAVWIAGGPELTITLAKPERIDRVVFSNNRGLDTNTKFFRIPFVGDYRIEVSGDGVTWSEVASSHDRQPMTPAWRRKRLLELEMTREERSRLAALGTELARVKEQLAAVPALSSWWVGVFRAAPGPFTTHIGGDPQRKGESVVVASLSAFSAVTPGYELPAGAPEAERRLALARWLVAPENPLTARVLANRLWHYHFGIGIVDTPSDFGAMGSPPSHPELLDWLAGQVHLQGWRLKPLHRLIVTSAAYRQASAFRPDAARIEGDSRLLWRFPPRRLAAEEVRDTILALAGRLDRRMGGPGYRLYRYLEDNVATYVPLDEAGPETYRRAVYHQNARASRADVLTDFDCPDFALAAPRRAATTSPLQALTLMNHRFTLDMAGALAERLEREAGDDDPEGQVCRAFLLAYGRRPDAEEVRLAARLARRHGLRAFCRAVLNSNELIAVN